MAQSIINYNHNYLKVIWLKLKLVELKINITEQILKYVIIIIIIITKDNIAVQKKISCHDYLNEFTTKMLQSKVVVDRKQTEFK